MPDIWSRLLTKMGIKYRSETQWFWMRNLILHLPGGIVLGAVTWSLSFVAEWFWALNGSAMFAVLLWKESKDQKQSKWKRAFDIVFWMIGFLSIWVLKEFI